MRDAAALKVNRVEHVAYDFFGDVVVAVDFLDDDAAFLFHLLLVHARVHEHVGDDVNCGGEVAAFNLCVKASLLTGGVGLEVSSMVLNGSGDFKCGAVLGSLEHKVLVKVAQSKFIFCFVAASARHPCADGGGIGVRHVVCENCNSVIENSLFNNLLHRVLGARI